MRTYYLRIREKFIAEIKNRNKKREYRLASSERMQIKVGDTLVLVSNQNRKNFIKTTVKAIERFSGWDEPLKKYWEEDFKCLFNTYDEALHECHKFYTREEVEQYGIVVFDIEPIVNNYSKMSVLVDTNIVIRRESSNNVSFEIAKLFNWMMKNQITVYIHRLTKDELSKYGNEKAKSAMLTKLNSYNVLPSFSVVEDEKLNAVLSNYSNDHNGQVDNALLKEVYNNNVGLLLTDDSLILKKAEDLYIRDRALSSNELLAIFENMFPQNIEYKMLSVKLKTFAEVDINAAFFDTLREDYGGCDFDLWFKRKANEKAYIFEDENGLRGFLYLKIENEEESYIDISPAFSPAKRLKVGTFKIESTGFRLGERFLKIIFDNAIKNSVDEIYVTLFEDKRDNVKLLKSIMEQWGFKKHGYKNNGELVLVKSMSSYDTSMNPKYNYPLTLESANHYILPIYAKYHTDLFPDYILKNEDMHLYEDNMAHRYAIEKIYLSGAHNIQAKPGDLVLIYRNGERYPKRYSSVVTGVTIIQDIIKTNSVEECIEECKNRSVFSQDDIKKIYSKYSTVIKLLDYLPFKNKVPLYKLYDNNIIEQGKGPRPFDVLDKEQFTKIINLGLEE